MFIDELNIRIMAGKGGNGIVSWMHEKGLDHAGPGGGDGGKGGDVYLRGVRDIGLLYKYRFIKEFKASNGERGKKKRMTGKSGEDLVVDLPIGSVVKNLKTGKEVEVMTDEKIFFLKGGMGGFGNDHFKGPKNINPMEATPGKDGEEGDFLIELKLVVDLGLVGLPNAGKSSLLNALTKANAKVGSYEFTTISPNLGDFYGFIIADIPGLIEGASEGKGLGHNFLRHISRTKAIMHCISAENEDPLKQYMMVKNELSQYDKSLLNKPEIILITKSDLVSEERLKEIMMIFDKKSDNVFNVSTIDDSKLKDLGDSIVRILRSI